MGGRKPEASAFRDGDEGVQAEQVDTHEPTPDCHSCN